jgi:hypothetical protein
MLRQVSALRNSLNVQVFYGFAFFIPIIQTLYTQSATLFGVYQKILFTIYTRKPSQIEMCAASLT